MSVGCVNERCILLPAPRFHRQTWSESHWLDRSRAFIKTTDQTFFEFQLAQLWNPKWIMGAKGNIAALSPVMWHRFNSTDSRVIAAVNYPFNPMSLISEIGAFFSPDMSVVLRPALLRVFEVPRFRRVVWSTVDSLSPPSDRQRYHSTNHPTPPVPRPAGRHPALPRASALGPAALQRAVEASHLPPQLVETSHSPAAAETSYYWRPRLACASYCCHVLSARLATFCLSLA